MKKGRKFEFVYIVGLLLILFFAIIANSILNIREETIGIVMVATFFMILLMLGFAQPHVINEEFHKENITDGKHEDAPYFYFVKDASESNEMKHLYRQKVLFNPMIYIIGSLAVFVYRLSVGQSSNSVLVNNVLRICSVVVILLSIVLYIKIRAKIWEYVKKKHDEFFYPRFGLTNAKDDPNIKKYTDELYNNSKEVYESKYGNVIDGLKTTSQEAKTVDESIYVFSCAYSFSIVYGPFRRNGHRDFASTIVAYNNYQELFSKTDQSKTLDNIKQKYDFIETLDGKTMLVKTPDFRFRMSGRFKYFRAYLMDFFKNCEEVYQMTRLE